MAKGTQEPTKLEGNEELIQEMLRSVPDIGDIPGELSRNPVIHRGDESLPVPMVAQKISSAGYYFVWDTRTGEKIPILGYMLAQKARLRRPDGSYRFTIVEPKEKPKMGSVKCMLHPDDSQRGHYDEMGFRVCNKSNLLNQHQLRLHMIRKHSQEWAAIEQERMDKEKKEDRDLQHLFLERAIK